MSLPYEKDRIRFAKQLRKDMTPWERKLWYEFLRGYPVRFQRQKTIGPYIVDFYCHRARLVLELDGGQHYGAAEMEKDRHRMNELEKMGLAVLRFSNLDVDKQFEAVCRQIDASVNASLREGGAPKGRREQAGD